MKKENLTIPVSRKYLEQELHCLTLARKWRDLEIHFVKKLTAPYVISEINRISAIMFNLDHRDGDIFDDTYTYIVVYDREHGEIVSFYRYIICKNAVYGKRDICLSTHTYFEFSDEFIEKILPSTIEFGRSVVNKTARNQENGLQAVWIGLGVLVYEYHLHPKDITIKYFFGKFSIQWNIYNEAARNMILFLFKKHFPPVYGEDKDIYVRPRFEYETLLNFALPEATINASQYKADKKILVHYLKNIGLSMPKLAEVYANLGGLISFGTVFNEHLNSWETAILQKISEIDSFYIKRFVDEYETTNSLLFN